MCRWAIALAVKPVDFAHKGELRRRAEFQRPAQNGGLGRTMVRSIEQVGEIARIVIVIGPQFEQQRVFDQWAGYHATDSGVRAATAAIQQRAFNRRTDFALEFFGRVAGVDQHRAAGDIAAKQHALRTAQDLHAVEIEQVEHHAAVEAQIDAVDEHADSGVN